MPPLLEAVPDEIVVREGADVGGEAFHALPPVTAALPLGWRTRRRYDDGDTPSAFAAARTGSFWLATMRSGRSETCSLGRPNRFPSARARRRPPLTLSTISDLSTCAMAAMIVKTAVPNGDPARHGAIVTNIHLAALPALVAS